MASEKFLDWLREAIRKIAKGEPQDKPLFADRIRTYLALRENGYSRDQACEIMDLYLEEEEEA